jgi:hypothetical protein
MSRIDACGGCGTELSPGARYCVKCGRTQAPPLLDLERLQASSSPEPAVERAVAEQGRPRASRRGVAALAAVAVLSVGAVLVLSGGDTDDAGDPSEPTTTSEPDRTTRPRRSTTTVPGRVEAQIAATPPLLGAPTGGLSLYGLKGAGLFRLELDTGALSIVSSHTLPSGPFPVSMHLRDGRLVVLLGDGVYVTPLDLSAAPTWLRDVRGDVGFGGRSDRILRGFDHDQMSGMVREVREFDLDGNEVARWHVPEHSWPVDAIGDRLIVQAAGRMYFVDGGGAVEPFAVGDLIDVNGQQILWRACDEQLSCSMWHDDIEQRMSRRLPFDAETFGPWGPLVAPDGATAVALAGREVQLVEVSTGRLIASVPTTARPAWSPDGDWLFACDELGDIVAISTRGGDRVEFDLPDVAGSGSPDAMLAVG